LGEGYQKEQAVKTRGKKAASLLKEERDSDS
jgi:hypothetical protein